MLCGASAGGGELWVGSLGAGVDSGAGAGVGTGVDDGDGLGDVLVEVEPPLAPSDIHQPPLSLIQW